MLAQSLVSGNWVCSWRRSATSRVRGSSPHSRPSYSVSTMRTEPPNDNGNWLAITTGMPAWCSACAMLAPTPITPPTAPLLQLASVTTAGLDALPSRPPATPPTPPTLPRRTVRSALARRSPLTMSAGPCGSPAVCSSRPKRVSKPALRSPPWARMCTWVKACSAQACSTASSVASVSTVRCWATLAGLPAQAARQPRSATRWARSGTGGRPAGLASTSSTRVSCGQARVCWATRRVSRVMQMGACCCSSTGWPAPGQALGARASSKGSNASSLADRTRRRCSGVAGASCAGPWPRCSSAARPGMVASRPASQRAVSCSWNWRASSPSR